MTRKLPFFFIVLFAAIFLEALKVDYYNRSLIAALSLAALFFAYVVYQFIFRKRPIGRSHILLGTPIAILLALLALGDLVGLSQVAIWVIFASATVLCVGFAWQRAR